MQWYFRRERERKVHECLIHQKVRKLRVNPLRNANPSNIGGSLLEGDKDYLLNQARSELMKQELHLESPNK